MLTKTTSIDQWVKANRGLVSAIARLCEMTTAHVSGVLRKKHYSAGGVIEGLLADLGAPGMRERQEEAELRGSDAWTKAEIARLFKKLRAIQQKRRAA